MMNLFNKKPPPRELTLNQVGLNYIDRVNIFVKSAFDDLPAQQLETLITNISNGLLDDLKATTKYLNAINKFHIFDTKSSESHILRSIDTQKPLADELLRPIIQATNIGNNHFYSFSASTPFCAIYIYTGGKDMHYLFTPMHLLCCNSGIQTITEAINQSGKPQTTENMLNNLGKFIPALYNAGGNPKPSHTTAPFYFFSMSHASLWLLYMHKTKYYERNYLAQRPTQYQETQPIIEAYNLLISNNLDNTELVLKAEEYLLELSKIGYLQTYQEGNAIKENRSRAINSGTWRHRGTNKPPQEIIDYWKWVWQLP